MRPNRSLTEGSIGRGMVYFALPILYANVLQSRNASTNSKAGSWRSTHIVSGHLTTDAACG